MIEKIARDVSNKLNTTLSKDFEDMVGLEAHLKNMKSLLRLDDEDGVMIVGIAGPAGIGKTTIARALHSLLSRSFELSCFMENLRGSYNSGLDEYGLKLRLQEQLLSRILNHNGMRICHLGAIKERLYDQKVLIFLDDVDDLKQLEALVNKTNWFGPGSRIIVTTEDREILEQHGIKSTYCVDFPTWNEASKIFCRYAFRHSSPPAGFEKLDGRVTYLCGNLPLGLRVMGSSLCGKKENEWEVILHRLENSLNRDIEGVLRVGYDNLHENDQSLFLHIAIFFNYYDDDYVMAMLANSNWDVGFGLKTLACKSLIQISNEENIVMHKLLQQVGRQAVQRQEPWKRQILIDAPEICDVLETASGSRSVMGISLDMSTILEDIFISARAFKSMRNLRFLSVYKTRSDRSNRVHVPEDMDFPPRLRLLYWNEYPRKFLPPTFCPEYLVELHMQENKLEKLWEGTQLLTNLKKMDLSGSMNMKELPDLSSATNLESLALSNCQSLVMLPSSIENLHKLEMLEMKFCMNLQIIPTQLNLASLENVNMFGCWRLRKTPDISTNITSLSITDTMLEELPGSTRLWSRLRKLRIFGSVKTVHAGKNLQYQYRSGPDIEKIPECIKDLQGLRSLYIAGCPRIASLPELPPRLIKLVVDTCESLETLSLPIDSTFLYLSFPNCFKLSREARRLITLQSLKILLPGRTVPAEFHHRAIGNFLTIRSDFSGFRICAVISPKQQIKKSYFDLSCHIRIIGYPIDEEIFHQMRVMQKEHIFITRSKLLDKVGWFEVEDEILIEFSITSPDIDIIECGVQILRCESDDDENLSNGSNEFDEPTVKRLKS